MGKTKGFLSAIQHREILMTDLGLKKIISHKSNGSIIFNFSTLFSGMIIDFKEISFYLSSGIKIIGKFGSYDILTYFLLGTI